MNIDTYLMNYSQEENFSPYEAEFSKERYNSPIESALKIAPKTTPSISSNYWVDFAKRAACIAEKEWREWDKGKRHETNPAFQPKLLSYYSSTQKTSTEANRAAKSNLNKKNRSPWSGAFISYVMKIAGAGHYFHYNSLHLNYILKAKGNRIKGLKNPFQLYALNEIRPEVGDLVCNSRGCFQKTFNNVDQAKNKINRCGDSQYEATSSHCDMVVEVDRKNNKIWVIGGNTGNEKRYFGGLPASTVGKKSRRLDSNGYLKKENKIFAILKIRKNLNVQAPNGGVIINPCSYSDINRGDKVGKQSGSSITSNTSGIGTTTTFLINKLTGLLNKGVISLSVFLAITSGNRNTNQLTDMVFYGRHPELNGRKLTASNQTLVREWVDIKKKLVLPLLRSAGSNTLPVVASTNSVNAQNNSAPTTHLLGTLIVEQQKYNLHPRQKFKYKFTKEDAIWLARFIVGEAGGKNNADNRAVMWAMFNRFSLLYYKGYWPTFTRFLRAYSTPLQSSLKSYRAAQRVIRRGEPLVYTGGYYKKKPSMKRLQSKRHLDLQNTPWHKLPNSARQLAIKTLNGQIPNPGIGVASQFANTKVYYKQNHGGRTPNKGEWIKYTKRHAQNENWTWIGEKADLNQMGKNAFFIDNRHKNIPPEAIRIII